MSWKDKGTKWLDMLHKAEWGYGIPEDLLCRQCYEESRFNENARNKDSGAVGLMQLLPKFFPGAGMDPARDIKTAANYMMSLEKRFGDWQMALAGYNWGPGNLTKWEHGGSQWAKLPRETRNYLIQILTDVPIQGVICKIPILPETGDPQPKSSAGAPSGSPLPSSSSRSVIDSISNWAKNLVPRSPPPAPHSQVILFPQGQQQETMMNQVEIQALGAAAPAINNVLDAINQFALDIGADPEKWKLTVMPAAQKLLGSVELQIPTVLTAEGGQLQGLVQAKVTELKAKLAAAVAPPPVLQPETVAAKAM